jgi:hypothetical protein
MLNTSEARLSKPAKPDALRGGGKQPFRFNLSSSTNPPGTERALINVNQNMFTGQAKVRVISAFVPKVEFGTNEPGLYIRSSLAQMTYTNDVVEPANILCMIRNKGNADGNDATDLTQLTVNNQDEEQANYQATDDSYILTNVPYSFDVYVTTCRDGGRLMDDNAVPFDWVVVLEITPV